MGLEEKLIVLGERFFNAVLALWFAGLFGLLGIICSGLISLDLEGIIPFVIFGVQLIMAISFLGISIIFIHIALEDILAISD